MSKRRTTVKETTAEHEGLLTETLSPREAREQPILDRVKAAGDPPRAGEDSVRKQQNAGSPGTKASRTFNAPPQGLGTCWLGPKE